jgi:hypothetical protein
MPPSAAGKLCERQDCKQRRRKRRKVEGQYAGACARTQENQTRHLDGLEAAGIDDIVITASPVKTTYDGIAIVGHKKGTYKIVKTN